MRFRALAVVLLASGTGCASHCSDGYSTSSVQMGPVGVGSSQYHKCDDACLDPVNPKPCGCSRQCPCWTQHQ